MKDVVDFISNVLDKITSLPGVGDILGAIDKLIAPLLDFVEDLLPKDALFPSIDFPIDVSDLDFGAVTDVFNNINLPELPSFDNVLDNIASKFDVDFSNAPLGEIFDFFDGIGDTVTTFGEKIEVAAERIGGVFDSIEEAEILSCAKWGEKSIPCSTAFAFIGMNDADCTIDIPWCEELNMTGLTSALEGIGDVFDGIIDVFKKDEERRKLTDFRDEEAFGGWGWFRTGDFTKIMTLECSFSSAAPFSCGLQDVFSGTDIYKTSFGRKDSLFNWMDWSSYQPKVSSGFKFSVKPITLTLDLGIFISNCGKWKFAFETSFSSSLEFAITVGEKKWLKDSIKIYGDYDPTKSSNELTKKAAQCFGFESLDDALDQNSWNQIKHHCIEKWVKEDKYQFAESGAKIEVPEEEREKRDICKGVCKAWEKVKTDYGKTECSKTDMEDLINQVEGTTGVSKTTTDKIAKCINEWKQFKKNVDDELRLFSPRLAGGKSGLPKFLSDWWHSELGQKLDVFKVPLPGVIFHADDKDEFENGLQIGVGLNLGDRGTKLGVTLWWCATCQSAEPYKMDTGSVGVGHVFDLLRAMIKDLPAAGSAAGSASSSLASGMQSAIKSAFDKIAVIDWPQTPVGRKAMELPSGDGQRGRNTGETIDFLKEMALKLDMTLKFSFGKISLGKPARVETGIFKDDEEVCD